MKSHKIYSERQKSSSLIFVERDGRHLKKGKPVLVSYTCSLIILIMQNHTEQVKNTALLNDILMIRKTGNTEKGKKVFTLFPLLNCYF